MTVLGATALLACVPRATAQSSATNGFAVRFAAADGKSADMLVLPNLWLYVESGKPATPFLEPGKFTAEFHGSIRAELRSDYSFKAEELHGSLKLEINNAVVLDTSVPGTLSRSVQLNKGANTVRATFTAPANGDAALRVEWTEKGTNGIPIPPSAIAHSTTMELGRAQEIHLGRELFLEHRCVRCHAAGAGALAPELNMDAPSFDGIGARRNAEWIAKWVLDPKGARASAHMPKLLHGAAAPEDAHVIAAYLGTLKADAPASTPPSPGFSPPNAKATREISQRSGVNARAVAGAALPDETGERKSLFERLHCSACHDAPGASAKDPEKISLNHVAGKFSRESLADFLKQPERHFAWTRMPNFKLADAEATELAEYLWKSAAKPRASAAVADKSLIARGRTLVQSRGCLNCHTDSKLENSHHAPALAKLPAAAKGCLADKRDDRPDAPDFGFDTAERAALIAFLQTDRASLQRHSPLEFTSRMTRLLQCNACHGRIDLVPPLEVLGGKLKPEWAAQFLAGEPFKVRADIHPGGAAWVGARMPAFRSRAVLLAEAMAMEQGYGPRTRDEGPIDEEAARIGHKMTGKDNGLSCISCHAVNDLPALEVFESEGTNLGLAAARLLKPFFFRWMRNPLAIDPQTKMPAYFEDGQSALTEYYGGDAGQQINALYHYMRLAEKMPRPAAE